MSFTETLQSITGKLLADCTDQELYLALLELVRQKSADRVQPVTGRKLYYISAEFRDLCEVVQRAVDAVQTVQHSVHKAT